MATSVAMRQRRLLLQARHHWFGLDHSGGPVRHWRLPARGIGEDERLAYVTAAAAIQRRSTGWRRRKPFCSPKTTQKDIRDDIVCEFCLVGLPVILMQPGIISGHDNGDWTCADCDPDVAGPIIQMWALERLVGAESA